ncbi:MAG TPA: TIGR00159 family protein [Proteobacteria bacterium]|nr:TIGR00159 family protein [Pseudomonadota bacterium]
MLEFLKSLRWQDIADVALVTVILYWILTLIRGTRAIQMVFGLVVLGVAYLFAQGTELNTLTWILQTFLGSIVIIIVILFQNEIRRALALVGSNPLTGANPGEQKHLIEEVVKTVAALSNRRIGALIVLERSTGLKNYIEKGLAINGNISKDLLMSIFMPFSPIHDGAVIIGGGTVAAARCFLPLTLNPRLEKILGTRHRAALGLTEETDAVVVVVSEETGKISTACEGKLYSRLETDELKMMLEKLLAGSRKPLKPGHWWERLRVAVGTEKKPAA